MGTKADVMVHLDEQLAREQINEVCSLIESTPGVYGTHCAEHKPHLLVVEYDPDKVQSKHILDRVTGRGLHAELIGL